MIKNPFMLEEIFGEEIFLNKKISKLFNLLEMKCIISYDLYDSYNFYLKSQIIKNDSVFML